MHFFGCFSRRFHENTQWVSNFKRIFSLRKYKIFRPADGTLLARAETNWAFVGLEHGVPRRVPPELVAAFDVVPPEQEERSHGRFTRPHEQPGS